MSYGGDMWCLDQPVTGKVATETDLVIQALYRRLITPRGTLRGGEEEQAYGVDVSEYVGALGGDTAVAVLPAIVRGELLKDDRVLDVQVDATVATASNGSQVLTIIVSGELAADEGSFTFTTSVDETSVNFLGGAETL